MIKSYRSRETVEACLWNGENQEELKEFVGDNVEFKLSTNKPPIPYVNINGSEEIMEAGQLVVKDENDNIKIVSQSDLLEKYEILR